MRTRHSLRVLVIGTGAAFLFSTLLAAQERSSSQVRYSIQLLGTLGGLFSEGHGLNNKDFIPGQSLLPDNVTVHAFLSQKGRLTDLGTLGGTDSFVPVANHTVNEKGLVIGYSNISEIDPNNEGVCGYGPNLMCRPFVWEEGTMKALPMLGGNNGQALGINSRGQIAGQVETSDPDPCSPFAEGIAAVTWRDGRIDRVLPAFEGSAAGANAINDNGDIVGISGCFPTLYAVLWKNRVPINLGSLGGVFGNFPFDINNQGQVVGQSDLPGDNFHDPFLWQNGVMIDLGNLPGLPNGQAVGINNRGQVVGFSQDANGDENSAVAVLWENGTISDLNTLIPAGSPLFLMEATAINDRGQIAGFGQFPNGEHLGFLLTPCNANSSSYNDCSDTPAAVDLSGYEPSPPKFSSDSRLSGWHIARH